MLAVQTAIGGINEKAATVLSQSYNSMISCKGFHYGLNGSGISLLNQGETSTSSFSVFTSDFGTTKEKRMKIVYLTIDSAISKAISLTLKYNNNTSHTYTKTTGESGVQQMTFVIGKGVKARVARIGVSSPAWFEIHQIEADFTTSVS